MSNFFSKSLVLELIREKFWRIIFSFRAYNLHKEPDGTFRAPSLKLFNIMRVLLVHLSSSLSNNAS